MHELCAGFPAAVDARANAVRAAVFELNLQCDWRNAPIMSVAQSAPHAYRANERRASERLIRAPLDDATTTIFDVAPSLVSAPRPSHVVRHVSNFESRNAVPFALADCGCALAFAAAQLCAWSRTCVGCSRQTRCAGFLSAVRAGLVRRLAAARSRCSWLQ